MPLLCCTPFRQRKVACHTKRAKNAAASTTVDTDRPTKAIGGDDWLQTALFGFWRVKYEGGHGDLDASQGSEIKRWG